jgi:uncharacterized protein
VLQRLLLFSAIAVGVMVTLTLLLYPLFGLLFTASVTTFSAGLLANFFALKSFDNLPLSGGGLEWNNSGRRQLFTGLALGFAIALGVIALSLILQQARLEAHPSPPSFPGSLLFVAFFLLANSFGEELLFRGYAFQLLVARNGLFAGLLPCSILFALVHNGNAESSILGLVNTFLFGVVFGLAFLRTGALWMPFGLHAGWNLAHPIMGATLSGFELGVVPWRVRATSADWIAGGAYGPEGGLLATLGALAMALLLYRFTRHEKGLS